jgi:hypothetical protein
MAKTRKPKSLSADDLQKYALLPPDLQTVVDLITDPLAKSKAIQKLYADSQTTAPTTTTTGGTVFTPGAGVTPTPSQTGRFEPALGLETGRFVDPVTGQVIAGTTQRVGAGTTSPMQELRGQPSPGYLPRYFDRDADLITRFNRDQIADIQGKLRSAGLLGSKYRIGTIDDATKSAWVKLLGEANRSNVDWQTALRIGVATPVSGTGEGAALPPKVSNPEDIAKIVQQVSSKILGRKADEQFVNNMVSRFQQSEVRQQTGLPVTGGRRVQPMSLETMTETQLQKRQGAEADAYKAAGFIEALLGGG